MSRKAVWFSIVAMAVTVPAIAQINSPLESSQRPSAQPIPWSVHVQAASAVVVVGPVYATFVQAGLPCFGCVVPSGGSTPAPYTYGSGEPIGTWGSATTLEYVVYVSNLSCPSAPSGHDNLVFSFVLREGTKSLDHSSVKENVAPGYVTYYAFNRNRPQGITTGYASLKGSVTCVTVTPHVTSVAEVRLYFE